MNYTEKINADLHSVQNIAESTFPDHFLLKYVLSTLPDLIKAFSFVAVFHWTKFSARNDISIVKIEKINCDWACPVLMTMATIFCNDLFFVIYRI